MGSNNFYNTISDNNKAWSEKKLQENPEFFKGLAKGHETPLLRIGCPEDFISAMEIKGMEPEGVFTPCSNINMVVKSDVNMLGVLDYAINILQVEHIIIFGHSGYDPLKATVYKQHADSWMKHIKDVYRLQSQGNDITDDETECLNVFVENKVKKHVFDIAKTSIVQAAWEKGQDLNLHGWIYGLDSGIVTDLGINLSDNKDLDAAYRLML